MKQSKNWHHAISILIIDVSPVAIGLYLIIRFM